ncbi:MAG: lipoyl(octanoyl) transferase LipB [Bacteroidales bacterium]|jgi:lipoyl(octanoyl) transferase|nr:lipoyl(octanoyl) transferase LipB [Bacteroidales bacterium]
MQKVKVLDWGTKEYKQAWKDQEELFNAILETKRAQVCAPLATQDYLILVEHPHVYTLGKSGEEDNLLLDYMQLQAKEAQFVHTNRGGDITYHGPGQLVGYPILNLENFNIGLREYIDRLEQSIINTIAHYGLTGARAKGAAGVWLDVGTLNERKICAIGVKISRYVTMHGYALNVNTDLSYFSHINPCGFTDKGVTSLQKELGREMAISEVKKIYTEEFEKLFIA